MINSKNKGNTYERQLVNELKVVFNKTDIYTSRNASKLLDDQKVDIFNTPIINIQAKFYKNYLSLNSISSILDSMPDDKINTVFHKANRKTELIVLKKEDFYKLLKKLTKNQ